MQQNEKAMNIVLDFDNYINAIRTVKKLYLSVVDLQVSTNVFKNPNQMKFHLQMKHQKLSTVSLSSFASAIQ